MDSSGDERVGLGGRRQADSDEDDLDAPGLGFGVKGKRKRKGSNDEALFGIFGEREGGGRKRGAKGGQRSGDSGAAPTFVKGTTLNQTVIPRKADGEKGASDDEIDPRFRLDANSANAKDIQPTVEGPKLPARNKLSFNQMASNYGKGFAMLQKMGFSGGGLGRHNDGIANPIEVAVRKGREGLQDKGEKVQQDLYGRDQGYRPIDEEAEAKPKKKKEEPGPADGWKRDSKAKKQKVTYKTAAELAPEPARIRIVDMRGPEVRVVSSFSELAASISGDSVKSLKELRHNTRLLVARYEDKVRAAADRKRHFEDIILSVAREQERIQATQGLEKDEVAHCREVVQKVEGLRERQDLGELNLVELCAELKKLRSQWPKEFRALRAMDAGYALAAPVAKRDLAVWQPLEKPDQGLAAFKPWREMTESEQALGNTSADRALTALVEATLLPKLRSSLSSWSPRDCDPCIRLIERCKAVLPKETAEQMAAEVVLPRLVTEVEAWDPRVDKASSHLWLHPWLPVLGDRLSALWAPVRFKLSACLERWNPSDHSAHDILKPWKQVFDLANWDPLIEKVLMKLERAINETPIKPDGQDVQPIKDMLIWLDLAPLSGLAQVLETAFFPQWHAALRSWLRSSGCDFTEVLQWYQGWRSIFPEQLRKQRVVEKELKKGLQVMQMIMAKGGGDVEDLDGPETSAGLSGERAYASTAAPKVQNVEDINLSLSDYLAEVAGENGLVFRPKKTEHMGKQVYQLGSASLILDKNLVFVAPKGGQAGEWRPMDLEELLRFAQEKTNGGKKTKERT